MCIRDRSGGLLEEQDDVLALEIAVRNASALHILEVLGAVSYTHLDVYKRQARKDASGRLTRGRSDRQRHKRLVGVEARVFAAQRCV